MDYFPIFTDIKNQQCLVIGGGNIALRKISLLLKANAKVTCITKFCIDEIKELNIDIIIKDFEDSDIDKQKLIICATNDMQLNQRVAKIATMKNIFVNVVDNPKLCTFIMPSMIDRNPIIIAVSSGGKAPVLARLIRTKLESTIPNYYGKLALIASEFRDKVKAKFINIENRRYFWESIFSGTIAEKVFNGKIDEAKKDIQDKLNNSDDKQVGEVYLVGGGPGDPDLLTFKALRLMQQADIVLYDRLVSKEVMDLVRRDARLIYVGKERDNHTVSQEGINQLLVDLAKQGNRVCRLKGGDPFIFGRGGEEIDTLAQNNIPFQVVPGITAASGCSTYSGIPLTHRDYSQSCRFVTGHLKDGTMDLPWSELVVTNQTIVFYMALVGAKYLSEQLIKHGMSVDTPVALVEKGTTFEQKVYITNLLEISDIIDNNVIHAPTLIMLEMLLNYIKSLIGLQNSCLLLAKYNASNILKIKKQIIALNNCKEFYKKFLKIFSDDITNV